jgi:hypothetical protein
MSVPNAIGLVSPISSNVSEMGISTPVDKKNGVVFYELRYLLEKLDRDNNKDEKIDVINNIVEILRPLIILYDAETFYLQDDVNKYIDILKDIFTNHKNLIKYIFKIDRIIPISSANGRIFILKTLSNKYKTSKLLVKVAIEKTSDPISYEYYVGLALNRLRVDYNIDFFAVMYGRFFCGLDPKIDTNKDNLDNIELCDNIYDKKTHLLYEFIRNVETEEVFTLYDYIEELKNVDSFDREMNILNIMILVLYALQEAQDKMQFTHYDLHAKNILVVKLSERKVYNLNYKNVNMIIMTDVVPHIIDYGRSHIDPKTAVSENGMFKDYETDIVFSDFGFYQTFIFKKYTLSRENVDHLEMLKRIERHLDKLANLYNIETSRILQFKIDMLEAYYKGKGEIVNNEFKIIKCDFGIDTRKSHKKYDFFKICRIVGGMISNISRQKKLYSQDIWANLGDELELQYPFHDGLFYSLVSDYEPNPIQMSDRDSFNEPIDVAHYLYNELYNVMQYGGGEKNEIRINYKDNMKKTNENKSELKIDLELIKKNLQSKKKKYDFMNIDYSDMNAGSITIDMDTNTNTIPNANKN